MGIDSVVNEYSLIHYKQQNELKEGSLQERLVVVKGADGKKGLDIRTLSLWERFQALFDYGPAAKSAVLDCINVSPQKEDLADKVAFIFDESLSKPRHIVVLSSISDCRNRALLTELLERPEFRERVNEKIVDGDTALMQSISKNNRVGFTALLQADGIDLNVWNHEKEYNALILAIEKDRPEFVKQLIAKGCKIPVKAFLEAKNHPSMLTAIKGATAEQKSALLVDAVEKNNDAALKKIINDIHGIDMMPALEHALRYEKAEMIDKLIGHGISEQEAEAAAIHEWARGNVSLKSPLFLKLVSTNPYPDLIEINPVESVRTSEEYQQLLRISKSKPDFATLMKASVRGNWNLVEAMLLENVVEHYESDGASKILLRAASRAGPKVVELLLEKGADPLYKDSRGHTAQERAEQRLNHGHIPGGKDQATEVLTLLKSQS